MILVDDEDIEDTLVRALFGAKLDLAHMESLGIVGSLSNPKRLCRTAFRRLFSSSKKAKACVCGTRRAGGTKCGHVLPALDPPTAALESLLNPRRRSSHSSRASDSWSCDLFWDNPSETSFVTTKNYRHHLSPP